ncbi:MAG: hypothetical protein IJX18_01240 [Clostridia bacterium]|nr:hypothetical protein [Clostridia bacterium]
MERKSAIRQLFYDEKGRYDEIPHSDDYFLLLEKVADCDEALLSALQKRPELLELYKNTMQANDNLWNEELYCHFAEGLRFRLALDIFQER